MESLRPWVAMTVDVENRSMTTATDRETTSKDSSSAVELDGVTDITRRR